MTTAAPSAALATIQPVFTDAERICPRRLPGRIPRPDARGVRLGLAPVHQLVPDPVPGFVRRPPRGHRGLRQGPGGAGPGPRHGHPRLSTIAGFYKYAVEGELLGSSPAAHVRRPRVDYDSHAVALDRNELGALLVAAGLGSPGEHALISLMVLNGLQVSEATGADIEHLGLERGHWTLTITRKGGKIVTIPLAPRTARAIDLAIGEHTEGPVFLACDGRRLDRHGAGRIVRKTARRAGITKTVTPHTLRHTFITAALDAGVPLRDVQEAASHADPRTTMRYDRAAAAWTATRPISSRPTSQVPPGNREDRGLRRLAAAAARRRLAIIASDGPQTQPEREPPIWAATWISRATVVTAPQRLFGSRPGESKPWLV